MKGPGLSAVKIFEDIVIPKTSFELAMTLVGDFLEKYVPMVMGKEEEPAAGKDKALREMYLDMKLQKFMETLTSSLWPEELAIARGRKKLFSRPFNTKLYAAIDG